MKPPETFLESGYNCGRTEPDSRVAEIRANKEKPEPIPEPVPCPKCDGSGTVVAKDDEGKQTGTSYCEDCKGTGAVL